MNEWPTFNPFNLSLEECVHGPKRFSHMDNGTLDLGDVPRLKPDERPLTIYWEERLTIESHTCTEGIGQAGDTDG